MKQKQDLILIGGGGHCRSCIDVIEMEGRFSFRGIVDEKDCLDHGLSPYPLLGRAEDLFDLAKSCRNFLITIGQIKSPEPRIRLFKYLKRRSESRKRLSGKASPLGADPPPARRRRSTK